MPAKQARRAAIWLTDISEDFVEDCYALAHERLKDFARQQGMDPESIHNIREYRHTTMPNITVVEASFYGKEDED